MTIVGKLRSRCPLRVRRHRLLALIYDASSYRELMVQREDWIWSKSLACRASLPPGMGTRELFEACVGDAFPIAGIDDGLLELHVGELVGEASYMHAIWIEPGYVLLRP